MRSALSVVLSDAVHDNIIQDNPCSGLNQGRRTGAGRTSSRSRTRKKRKEEVKCFGAEERNIFIEALDGEWLGPLLETMIRSGLRPGEAYALLPEDIDLEARLINVEKSLEELNAAVKVTKTEESREVRIHDDELLSLLTQYLAWHERLGTIPGWEAAPLFPSVPGTYLDAANVRGTMTRILRKAAIPKAGRTPYSCRHTYATSGLSVEGLDLGFVSHQLGHASVIVTLEYYYHWLPDRWKNEYDRRTRPADEDTGIAAGASSVPRDHQLQASADSASPQVTEDSGAGEWI